MKFFFSTLTKAWCLIFLVFLISTQSVAQTAAPQFLGFDNPKPAIVPVTQSPPPIRVLPVIDIRACTKPEYPPKSFRDKETGTVTLQFLVSVDGRVIESKVEKSSGYRDLDIAARNVLSLCKFKPGTIDGKPEQSWAKIAYVWKIDDANPANRINNKFNITISEIKGYQLINNKQVEILWVKKRDGIWNELHDQILFSEFKEIENKDSLLRLFDEERKIELFFQPGIEKNQIDIQFSYLAGNPFNQSGFFKLGGNYFIIKQNVISNQNN